MSEFSHSHFRPAGGLERLTSGLLGASLAFAPWAFGATQSWAIMVLNVTGSLLGLVWLLGKFLPGKNSAAPIAPRHWTTTVLLAGTVLILAYSLIAALNARSAFDLASLAFRPLPHWSWLPASYDRRASWLACWQNFALAGTFWAVRDWLLAGHKNGGGENPLRPIGLLPARARQLIFFLVTNGFLLAVVALLQRLDNTPKLLWLVQPRINAEAWAQFGPFAYRSNGLQYLALVWPLGLGLWSMLAPARREASPLGSGQSRWLLLGALVMLVCPLLWESRLAVAVDLLAGTAAALVLLQAHRAGKFRRWLAGGILLALALGLALNWHGVAGRFAQSGLQSGERAKLFSAGGEMFRDNWLFGTGPGTFRSLYHLYRPDEASRWQVYLHSDWLETLTTYGVVGFLLVAAVFLALFCAPLNRRQLPARGSFILLAAIGLGSCLLHATLDFPFQIYSVQQLFVVLAALYSVLSWRA